MTLRYHSILKGLFFGCCVLLLGAMSTIVGAVGAAEGADADAADRAGLAARFAAFDPASEVRVSYPDWEFVLKSTVLDVGPSHRFSLRRKAEVTGTRITRQNMSPSWLEGNRVAYDQLNDDGIQVVGDFRRMMEHLPDEVDLARLNRNEQLAYWLNLYNATLYEQVAQAYPRQVVRATRIGEAIKSDLFTRKLLTVKGVPLSLDDIQFGILLPLWRDPLVIYGLYQGAIGGPSIRRHAFTGATVRRQLRESAEDFVNSIRGVQKAGGRVRVSTFYDWNRALFPDFEADLRAHLAQYADGDTRAILADTEGVRADYYDWGPTDFHNGSPNYVRMLPTIQGDYNIFGMNFNAINQAPVIRDTATQVMTPFPEATLPPQTLKFFRTLEVKFKVFGYPETNIEIEELGVRPDAEGEEPDNPENPEEPEKPQN